MSRSHTAPLFKPSDSQNGSLNHNFSYYTPSMPAEFSACCPPHSSVALGHNPGGTLHTASAFSATQECDVSHFTSNYVAAQGGAATRLQPRAARAPQVHVAKRGQSISARATVLPCSTVAARIGAQQHTARPQGAPAQTITQPTPGSINLVSKRGSTAVAALKRTTLPLPAPSLHTQAQNYERSAAVMGMAVSKPTGQKVTGTRHQPTKLAARPASLAGALKTVQAVPTPKATPLAKLTPVADPACQAAARARTSAAQLEHMVALRRSGLSLRQIGRQVGRCMEGVRQALMRYEQAREDTPPQTLALTQNDTWLDDPLREPEPMPPGHPVAMRGLWRGLEHWRGLV